MIPHRHINFLHKKNDFDTTEPPKKRVPIFVLISVLLLAVVMASTLAVMGMHQSVDSVEYDPITLEPKKPEGFFKKLTYLVFKKEVTLVGEKRDRINVLLLGIGGPGHDGPYLTDTIMIASIKPSTQEVALISIPRDLGVQIKNRGVYKINHANAFGEMEKSNWGSAYATEVISDVFELDIHYYVRLDFKAFEEIIDEVGGVRIEVERAFTDYTYPGPRYSYQTVTFQTGPQTMNGDTALKYVRSRHGNNGEGSDFARAKRQQKVIVALKEKILSFGTLANPIRIKKIMDALEKNMTTNMQFDEVIEFVRIARELNATEIKTLVLDNSVNGFLVNGTTPGGAYILSPKTGSFAEINQAIQNIFDSDVMTITHSTPTEQTPPPMSEDASLEIQNGTWSAGLAARAKQRLVDASMFVDTIGNVPPENKPITSSGIYVLSSSVTETARSIETLLKIPIRTDIPENLAPLASNTNIMVILGDDFVE